MTGINIAFLTTVPITDIKRHGIYPDLVRMLVEKGNSVSIFFPIEKRNAGLSRLASSKDGRVEYVGIKTGNLTKCGLIEKAVSMLTLESVFWRAINKVPRRFDLILYSTPPITFHKAVFKLKKRDNAVTYLMLKDIFPQNSVDLGMLSRHGLKGLVYRYFRNKERKLYSVSDYIGCMSPANVEYVLQNNPPLDPEKVGLCPNSIIPDETVKKKIAPNGKLRFLYGGNLGKPQGVDFLMKCILACHNLKNVEFVICGTGTELKRLTDFGKQHRFENVQIIPGLPKEEYEEMVKSADVGMIFLDYRFTIPNFPSRLLSYLDKSLPVLVCTDPVSDMGRIVEANSCGWYVPSNDVDAFVTKVKKICSMSNEELVEMGINGNKLLKRDYDAEKVANDIILKYKEIEAGR